MLELKHCLSIAVLAGLLSTLAQRGVAQDPQAQTPPPITPPSVNLSSDSPSYLLLKGSFVIVGKQPQGDSVRFRPDQVKLLKALPNGYRLRIANDGTVPIQLEGLEAPELSYKGYSQPGAHEARLELLRLLGFGGAVFGKDNRTVQSAAPNATRGALLITTLTHGGQVIAYAYSETEVAGLKDGSEIPLSPTFLSHSVNAQLLRKGFAYLSLHTRQPQEHHTLLRQLAQNARRAKQGVWFEDQTQAFPLDLKELTLKPIWPLLFRRVVQYNHDLKEDFEGSFKEWLLQRLEENIEIVVDGEAKLLSDVLEVQRDMVLLKADALGIVLEGEDCLEHLSRC